MKGSLRQRSPGSWELTIEMVEMLQIDSGSKRGTYLL